MKRFMTMKWVCWGVCQVRKGRKGISFWTLTQIRFGMDLDLEFARLAFHLPLTYILPSKCFNANYKVAIAVAHM